MRNDETIETGLFHVSQTGGRLLVRVRTDAYRPVLNLLTWISGGATVLLLAYLLATRQNPTYWWGAPVLLVIVLFLSARAADLRDAAREQVFAFDRTEGRLLRNAEVLTPVQHIDHILVREVIEEDRPPRQFALVVALDDTRRILMVEAIDLQDGKQQIETVARAVADFIGVPVRYATRQPGETWMDL